MTSICSIFASPRDAGVSFSSSLHESFLRTLEGDVQRFFPSRMNISHCTGCNACDETGECVIDDGMMILYPPLKNAELVTISYPLYFTGPPSPLKALIDRCHALWKIRSRLPVASRTRRAIIFACGGSAYSGMFSPSLTMLKHFLGTLSINIDLERSVFYCNTDSIPKKITVFPDFTDTIDGNY